MTTENSNRQHLIDEKFDSDISNCDYSNKLMLRIVAKGKKFERVDFRYTFFESCYFRNCIFDSCDFTGCRFNRVNFYGAKFTGCTFDYATFERTIIGNAILENSCPSWDNLKLKFARSLRMNFQELGDSDSVNRAIKVELDATEIHLHKSWKSNESYYRKKYSGIKRIGKFFQWLNFKLLDFIWGNGEKSLKLIRSVFIVLTVMTVIDVYKFKNIDKISDYIHSFVKMPEVFLGVYSPTGYPDWYIALIALSRLVSIGFFMSIIIKRFNRR